MANTRIKRFIASVLIMCMGCMSYPNHTYATDAGMYDNTLTEDDEVLYEDDEFVSDSAETDEVVEYDNFVSEESDIADEIEDINIDETIEIVADHEDDEKETSDLFSTDMIDSGTCGSLSWNLNDEGTLTISGSGQMDDFDLFSSDAWLADREQIKKTVIDSDITSIGNSAFQSCSNMIEVEIPDSVVTIGKCAFRDCTSLSSIALPDGITVINDSSFADCADLQSVTFSKTLTTIGESAFLRCSKLTDITFPKGLNYVGQFAFQGCDSIKTAGPAGGDYDVQFYWDAYIPRGGLSFTALEEVTIPDEIESIGPFAFRDCTKLTSITLPSGLSEIGEYAFYNTGLTSIELCDGMTCIPEGAFSNCKDLASVTIPESVTDIGDLAFHYNTSLKELELSDSVKNIGRWAFSYAGLESVVLPDGLEYVDSEAFSSCSNLETAGPKGGDYDVQLTQYNYNYINSFSELTTLVLPKEVANFDIGSISNIISKIENLTILEGTSCISNSDSNVAVGAKNVFLPQSLLTIGDSVFSGGPYTIRYASTKADWATIEVGENNDGLENAVIYCTDSDVVPVSGVTVEPKTLGLKMVENETGSVMAVVAPEDASNKTVLYSSSNESVATVDQEGLVTAISPGTATITVKTEDGEFTDTCLVNVARFILDKPTGIAWDGTSFRAKWDAVKYATKYQTYARVYNGNNLVTTIEKETTFTYMDLEQEIKTATNNLDCVYTDVVFNVYAKRDVGDETIISDASDDSEVRHYYLITELDKAINLRWLNGEAAVAYWTKVKHATSYVVLLTVAHHGIVIGSKSLTSITNQVDLYDSITEVAKDYENEAVVVTYTVFATYEDDNDTLIVGEASDVSPEREIVVLQRANNIHWKENTTATGTWSEVPGANYYIVNVLVENNGVEIGRTQTGTSNNEIDLQQEIYHVIGNCDADSVDVYFSVISQILQPDGAVISGQESIMSEALTYHTTAIQKLQAPQNVLISDDLVVSFNAVDNADYYSCWYWIEYDNRDYYGTINSIIYNNDGSANVNANMMSGISFACNNLNLVGEDVKVRVRVVSDVWGNTTGFFMPSDYSDWSNEVSFHVESMAVSKLSTPIIESVDNDTLVLRATCDPAAEECLFSIRYSVEDNYESYETRMGFSGYCDDMYVQEGKIYANLLPILKKELVKNGHLGVKLKVSFRIQSYSDKYFANSNIKMYEDSDETEWTEAIDFEVNDIPKLCTPANLKWNERDGENIITWDGDERANSVEDVEIRMRNDTYEVICTPNFGYTPPQYGEALNPDLFTTYRNSGFEPAPVYVSVRFRISTTNLNPVSSYEFCEPSELSDWSEELLYNPANKKMVETLTLAPADPVVAVGRSIYIGKTITPEDAYYQTIQWTCADNDVAEVDDMGKVTGKAVGTTSIGAKIYDAEGTANLSVYEIESNVDPEQTGAVLDDATEIIENIVVDGNPEHTDIEDVESAREEIEAGAQNGDTFHVDMGFIQEYFESYKDNWGQIKKAAKDLNAEFCGAYNINVELYHKDKNSEDHHIGNITEFENEITFTFDLPTGVKEKKVGEGKKYVLVRVHKNSGGETEYTPIDYTENEDGTFTADSDRFSDFVWLLADDPDYIHVAEVTLNPKTLNLKMGKTETGMLEAGILPENATNRNYTYSSDNESVAIVDQAGCVTAVSAGTARITVTAEDGGLNDTCEVTVEEADPVIVEVKSITLDPRSLSMTLGDTATIRAFAYPEDTDALMQFRSSDTSIVNVITTEQGSNTAVIEAVGKGTAIITAKADGIEKSCTVTVSYDVEDKDEENKKEGALWIGTVEDEYYDGNARKPEPNVYYGSKKLTNGVDYKLSYANNKNAASIGAVNPKSGKSIEPTVKVTFIGNYTGTLSQGFNILQADIEEATINTVFGYAKSKRRNGELIYTKQLLSPAIIYNGKTLKKGTDYELDYGDDDDSSFAEPGEYEIEVRGIGNFAGETVAIEKLMKKSETINLKSTVKVVRTDGGGNLNYTGEALSPTYVLRYKAKGDSEYTILEEDTDYTVSYSDNINPGTCKVTFIALGDPYYGSTTASFKIVRPKVSLKNNPALDLQLIGAEDGKVPFLKGGVKPEVKVTLGGEELVEGVDYKVSYKNNSKLSSDKTKASVVITGKGFYKDSYTMPFEVVKQDIGNLNIVVDDVAQSNKKNAYRNAKIKVYDLNGKELSGSDYTVDKKTAFGSNTDWNSPSETPANGSVISVTVHGKGSYEGQLTGSFKVVDKKMLISNAKVTFKVGTGAVYDPAKKSFVYNGKAVEPNEDNMTVTLTIGSGKKAQTINPAYEIVGYSGNTKAGTGKITIKGTGENGGLKTFTFKISKAD